MGHWVALVQAWHNFRMVELLFVAWWTYEAWEGFKVCRRLASFVRAVVDIIRSPERFLQAILQGFFQALFEPLISSAAKWLRFISIFAAGFGIACLLCCRPCSRRLAA